MDSPVLNEEWKAFPMARNVAKGAPASMNWEQVDVLHYIGLGEFLDVEHLGERPVKNWDF